MTKPHNTTKGGGGIPRSTISSRITQRGAPKEAEELNPVTDDRNTKSVDSTVSQQDIREGLESPEKIGPQQVHNMEQWEEHMDWTYMGHGEWASPEEPSVSSKQTNMAREP